MYGIIVKTQFEGIHCFPEAPEEVEYLAYPHRHIFGIELEIETFTDEGDVVIDPCCGSGTTLKAAYELNRNSYGFEIDRNFYTRAKDEMLNFKKELTDAENTNTIQKEI